MSKWLVWIAVVVGLFLRLYQLPTLMQFIGDQAWFYLSARDLILGKNFPLVGITSSHVWLHQGPLWTYMLALVLWIFRFNPVAPGYFTVIVDTVTIFLIYSLGKKIFDEKTALIAAFLYAVSPLAIFTARMPYHTSFIPIVSLFFLYFFFQVIEKKYDYLPWLFFSLGLLYNFELFTQILWILVLGWLGYLYVYRKKVFVDKITPKLFLLSLVSFLIPLIPVLIYDTTHGFLQTFGFLVWELYQPMKLFTSHSSLISYFHFVSFIVSNIQLLVFSVTAPVAIVLFFASIIWMLSQKTSNWKVISAMLLITLIIIVLLKTPSSAYIPILFIPTFFVLAGFISSVSQNIYIRGAIILCIVITNIISTITSHFFSGYPYGYNFKERMEVSRAIVKYSQGKSYNLLARGEGSQFASFTMNYEYLTWYLGNGPSDKSEKVKFIISEDQFGVHLEKKDL